MYCSIDKGQPQICPFHRIQSGTLLDYYSLTVTPRTKSASMTKGFRSLPQAASMLGHVTSVPMSQHKMC